MSDHLKESIQYIQGIDATKALSIQRQATRVAAQELIKKWLKIPIGTEEKAKALIAPVVPQINAKNSGYRRAGRALLLLELIYDYHGNGSVESFLAQRRAAILQYNDESRLRAAIQTKLNGLTPFVITGTTFRSYSDRGSNVAPVALNALSINGHQTGAPAMLTPTSGPWLHVFMSNTPGMVDFAQSPNVDGIFTTAASGGCIAVAFLFGGKKGQPLRACSLVHVPGGNPATAEWNKMALGTKLPSTIAVFLSTKNNLSSGDKDRFRQHLTNHLNYPESLIMFHECDNSVNHGVDRWGNFGSAFAPSGQIPSVLKTGSTASTNLVTL